MNILLIFKICSCVASEFGRQLRVIDEAFRFFCKVFRTTRLKEQACFAILDNLSGSAETGCYHRLSAGKSLNKRAAESLVADRRKYEES